MLELTVLLMNIDLVHVGQSKNWKTLLSETTTVLNNFAYKIVV